MATDKVDMSLDDIIRQQRGPRGGGGGGRGRGGRRGGGGYSGNRAPRGGFGGGGGRRFGSPGSGGGGGVRDGGVQKPRGARRPVYTRGDIDGKWQHDLYRSDLVTPVASSRDNSRLGKLLISNLDFGVSDSDITELFTEFGPLVRAAVHYDRSGRSLGTAEVLFEMRADAVKAQQQYDNVPLDGRPMKIQLVGSESTSQTTPRPRPLMDRIDGGGRQNFGQRERGRGRGRGRGGRGGGRDGNSGKTTLTKEQLDAQLDEYKMDVN